MAARCSCRASISDVLNAGRIATEGDVAFGIAIGVGRFGFIAAGDNEIINRGTIETHGNGAAGVVLIGDGHHLTNSGRVTADGGSFDSEVHAVFRAAGVLVSGDDALLENTRSGVIESRDAASAAVELNVVERDGLPASDMSSVLENFGFIRAPEIAVLGGAGQETVINHGRIVGDVALGDGADTFIFARSGTVAGDVLLGSGDDLVRIEDGSGATRIADFAAGILSGDVIDLSEFFSDFSELQAHSRQSGGNVIVTLDHNDRLVLEHVQLGELNAADFIFA